MRYNGFAAALPPVVLLFEWRVGLPRVKRYAIAAAAWLAITGAGFGLDAALTDRRAHFWYSTLALFDLAGTIRYAAPISDDDLREELAGTELLVDHDLYATIRRTYTPRAFRPLVAAPTAIWDVPFDGITSPPPAQREAIARAWWRIVTAHPIAYALHRTRVFLQVLDVSVSGLWGPTVRRRPRSNEQFQELGLALGATPLQDGWTAAASWLARYTPLYWPWLYLLGGLVVLRRGRHHRDVVALVLAGFALEASLFVLAPSPDYRYSHWMITCVVLAAVMLIARNYSDSGSGSGSAGLGSSCRPVGSSRGGRSSGSISTGDAMKIAASSFLNERFLYQSSARSLFSATSSTRWLSPCTRARWCSCSSTNDPTPLPCQSGCTASSSTNSGFMSRFSK